VFTRSASLLWLHGRLTFVSDRSSPRCTAVRSYYAQARSAASFVRPSVRQFAQVVTRRRGVFHDLQSDTGGAAGRPHVKILAVVFGATWRVWRYRVLSKRETVFNSRPAGRRRIDRHCRSGRPDGRAIDQSQRAVCSVVTAAAGGARWGCGMPGARASFRRRVLCRGVGWQAILNRIALLLPCAMTNLLYRLMLVYKLAPVLQSLVYCFFPICKFNSCPIWPYII